jgi:hypothetical protein
MRTPLATPREYRDFAAQCLRWAARAKHEEHKNMMLRMADHWTKAARELERAGTCGRVASAEHSASEPLLQDDARPTSSPSHNDFERASGEH